MPRKALVPARAALRFALQAADVAGVLGHTDDGLGLPVLDRHLHGA
jgi:hypothetical protein